MGLSAVQNRLEEFKQKSRIQASSLIISVFGDAVLPRGSRIWLGSLIQLLEHLDLNDRQIRTTVFRLQKEGWLVSETIGRRADYMLSPKGQLLFENAAQQIYAARAPLLDQRWRIILTVGEWTPKQREQLRRSLTWHGFGVLGNIGFIHPSFKLTTALSLLASDGLSDLVQQLMPLLAVDVPFDLSGTDTESKLVQQAWDLPLMAQAYEEFIQTYQPILQELRSKHAPISQVDAFLIRTLLIHDYRKLLLRDPELPGVLLPDNWPGEKARVLTQQIYRNLLEPSEQFLDTHFRLANETTPSSLAMLAERFRQDDPLEI